MIKAAELPFKAAEADKPTVLVVGVQSLKLALRGFRGLIMDEAWMSSNGSRMCAKDGSMWS
jgi:hypothetical protein